MLKKVYYQNTNRNKEFIGKFCMSSQDVNFKIRYKLEEFCYITNKYHKLSEMCEKLKEEELRVAVRQKKIKYIKKKKKLTM